MTQKEFKNLRRGDLVLSHNGHIRINDDWPFKMDFMIVTGCSGHGSSLVSFEGEDKKTAFFSNRNEDFELIEKGAFNSHPKYLESPVRISSWIEAW